MNDLTAVAADSASRAAHAIVRSVVDNLIYDLERGNIAPDDVSDAIHQACDSACIYVADQYALAWGLPDSDEDPCDLGVPSWSELLAARAFLNLREAVETDDALAAAITVARDAAEERSMLHPDDRAEVA